jgi:transaldolase
MSTMEADMNATQELHGLGQSLWLDNITRDLLDRGTLADYIHGLAITGLTSNPTIFEQAIAGSGAYDEAIRAGAGEGHGAEGLFFELALDDLTRAANQFRPVHDASAGLDGWVSLEVSPLLAHDAERTTRAALDLHERAGRPNLFIKIPGTAEGLKAVEESIFAGVPVNVTLLFSRTQCLAASTAYLRGIERRLAAGRDPDVASVASLFVSRWDAAVATLLPKRLHNRLGIAIATQTYRSHARLLASARWHTLAAAGARPQRLLWASTGTKDPAAPDTLYVERLVAPDTINTLPEKTLLAFADHGKPGPVLALEGGDGDEVLAQCRAAGIDIDELAARLQREGVEAFSASWRKLLARIAGKVEALAPGASRQLRSDPAPGVAA